jgi:hypothetical protein
VTGPEHLPPGAVVVTRVSDRTAHLIPQALADDAPAFREWVKPPQIEVRYCLMVDGENHPAQTYARDPEGFGAIQAVNHAQALSLAGGCSVYIGEQFLVRYEHGRRVNGDH